MYTPSKFINKSSNREIKKYFPKIQTLIKVLRDIDAATTLMLIYHRHYCPLATHDRH